MEDFIKGLQGEIKRLQVSFTYINCLQFQFNFQKSISILIFKFQSHRT